MSYKRVKQIGFILIFFVVFFISLTDVSAQGGAARSQDRSSDNKADQNLKSIARVNPSTLAMEMSVPLMNYPGRNGNSLPIGFSYSSKLWRMKSMATYFYTTPIGNYRQYVTQLRPMFAERSAAGWTSSVAFPVIEEKLETYDQTGNPFKSELDMESFDHFYQMANNADPSSSLVNNANLPCGSVCVERTRWCIGESCTEWQCTGYDWNIANCDGGGGGGNSCEYVNGYCPASCNFCTNPTQCPPWNPTCDNPDNTPPYQAPRKMHYVKRVYVRMGDGATHEFRKSDAVFGYCNGGNDDGPNCEPITPDNYGMFLSVDGSGMKLKRTTEGSTLYLPDGSRYTFTSDATGIFDGKSLYQAREFIDADGNRSQFNFTEEQNQLAANNQHLRKFTDTLGREVYDPFPQNLSEQTQKEGVQTINLPGLSGREPQSYQLKWLHLKPVPCNPPDVTTNCGSTEGALENQNENVYFYTAKTCAGSAEIPVDPNNLYPNQKLFPLEGNGLRACTQPNSGASPDVLRFNPVVLAEISLPNGKKYEFKYNQYGEITKITYPTGSVETFKYNKVAPMNGFNEPAYDQTNRGVVERKIYNAGGTLEQFWRYSAEFQYNNYTNQTYKITTIAPKGDNPSGNGVKTERYLYVDTRNENNFGFSDPRAGMPKEEKTYDENGTLRSRTLTEWIVAQPRTGGDSHATRDPRASRNVSVIIEGNKALATVSKTEYDEPPTPGNSGQTDPEYFSHLNVKRKKGYHYKVLSLNAAQTASLETIDGLFNDSTDLATISETDYLYNDNYKARGISSLPVESRLMNPANPAETLSKSQTVYDEPAYLDVNGSGSLTGNLASTWVNPASTQQIQDCLQNQQLQRQCRGKLTTSKTWQKETNDWIQTHTQYDQYGNVRKVWEPNEDINSARNVETQYSADYAFAYPTKMIAPAPDPTGVHGITQTSEATTTYDFMTGLPLTVTDSFGQATKTEYEDALLRPTKVSGVDGFVIPITETIYNDTNLTVKVRRQIEENNWDETTTYSDSLGRAFKTQTKDSQNDVFVETKYDFLGRVQMTASPYRLNDSEKYWNLTEYDALGRVKQTRAPVVNQDPSQPTGSIPGVTEYDLATAGDSTGTVVTATDAAGRKGRTITNALSQLVRVDESSSANTLESLPVPTVTPTPTPTPGDDECYELRQEDPTCLNRANDLTNEFPSVSTYYKYDALGNMTVVTQGAQKRYFKYDSLGRLIRVRQPEQEFNDNLDLPDAYNTSGKWTAGFVYDIFGNLKRTTDASGVNVVSEYDKANRVIKRCYTKPNVSTGATECSQVTGSSNASANTPPVEYFYDGKGLDQQQSPNYAKGKLTKVTSSISETRYKLFDNQGRLLESEQRTPAGMEIIANAIPKVSKYEYNLSGALVQQTYPSGRTVRSSFEADGDLTQVQSRVASTMPFKAYAGDFSYTTAGTISQLKLGNGRWETAKINSRQQITELALGTSPADTSLWKLNYDYGELQSNGVDVDSTKNTGGIAKQTISFAGLANSLVQTYKYDSLERLTEARETSGTAQSAPQTWKQQFGYDRFGNRTGFGQAIGQTQLQINSETLPEIEPLTNRFKSGQNYTYDKNGNLTIDAQNRQFSFNGDNKQTEVRNTNGEKVGEYFFDGEGRRVKKKAYFEGQITEETIFVYDGMGKLVAEYSTAPAPATRTTNYTTSDHLGSPRIITDASGTPTSRRDFMPFGEELNTDTSNRTTSLKYGQSDSVRQRFTGYQKDTETGLDFAEARMYENRHGRFTAVDPLLASGKSADPQTFNRYSYTSNNPIIRIDANGKIWGRAANGTVRWFGTKRALQKAGFEERSVGHRYEAPDGRLVELMSRGRWDYVDQGPAGDYTQKTQPLSSSQRQFIGGFNERLGQLGDAAVTGAKNVPVNFLNSVTDGATFQEIGIPFIVSYRHGLWGNPLHIQPFAYSSQRAQELGSAVEFGIPLGVGFAVGGVVNARAGGTSSLNLNNCFVAGTLITTEHGLVPIESVRTGDKVLSYNTETSGLEYQEVARLFRNTADEFLKIQVEGESKPITVTPGHPFYVHRNRSSLSADLDDEGDWVLSESLRVGDLLLSKTGEWKPILSIEKVAETNATYNFEVEQNHDYFVGENGWLVHNQSLADNALVVRGGQNLPENFATGSGVTIDGAGNLNGVSVNSANGLSVQELSVGMPHNQIGVTTVGEIRALGGNVVTSGTRFNPNHCTLCGITPEQASNLFRPTIRNPNK
jgi:RHS repeat-associated protein